MKVNKVLAGFLVAFVISVFLTSEILAVSPKNGLQTSQPKIDSFELFWPIVAGKVRGDSMYSLKLFKEKIRESLIFSSSKKAEYKITISEKRLVELETLYKNKDYINGAKSITDLKKAWEHVVSLINESSTNGLDVSSLKAKFVASLDKQSLVLKALSLGLKDDLKLEIENLLELAKETSSSI